MNPVNVRPNGDPNYDIAYFYIDDVEVYEDDLVGIVEEPGKDQGELTVSVYPNPNWGDLTVRFNSDIEADYRLIVTGLDGRYVSTFPLSSISTTVSLGSLSPGLYFVEITDVSGSSIFNGKIVLIE